MGHELKNRGFEWHDLPISKISIEKKGIVLSVLPFNELIQDYDQACLSLLEADSITFDIQGRLSLQNLDDLEVYDFEFADSGNGRITGTLGIIPGFGIGYWEIQFVNAIWKLEGPNKKETSNPAPQDR